MKILAFGKIAEIVEKSSWEIEAIDNTASLKNTLENAFPALQGMSYQISVNKKIVTEVVDLYQNDEIALLPPFSGG
ncbi:MAG: MoaD/ThiS family protein [Cyclobacteriaceae bacterium]